MKPMLSATANDIDDITLPVLASPKLDGIRAMVIDGKLVSRNLKPIPNLWIRNLFEHSQLNGLDGELIVGDPTDKDCFNRTTSAVRSRGGEPRDVKFHVFDWFLCPKLSFMHRLSGAVEVIERFNSPRLVVVPHHLVETEPDLVGFEKFCVESGYEGIMTRDPMGDYKLGRSTMNEQGLVKVKRFKDARARIVGFEEQMQNTNDPALDYLGRIKRTSHKSGMVGKDTLGALVVDGLEEPFLKTGLFHVGSGMNDELRQEIWYNRKRYLGRIIVFKYFPIGSKNAPRFPVFLRFEDIR